MTAAGLLSHGRARALQPGPVHAQLAARRAAEGLPAPEAELIAKQVVLVAGGRAVVAVAGGRANVAAVGDVFQRHWLRDRLLLRA